METATDSKELRMSKVKKSYEDIIADKSQPEVVRSAAAVALSVIREAELRAKAESLVRGWMGN